jgi:hypothetical protein
MRAFPRSNVARKIRGSAKALAAVCRNVLFKSKPGLFRMNAPFFGGPLKLFVFLFGGYTHSVAKLCDGLRKSRGCYLILCG